MNTSPSLSPPGSDLDGLVERLASRAESYRLSGPSAEHTAAILYEAASTLLSERALRERVEGERDEAQEDKRIALAVRDEMAKLAGQQRRRAEAAESRLSQLEAELKRRDEALRRVDYMFTARPDMHRLMGWAEHEVWNSVRAALQPQEGGDA